MCLNSARIDVLIRLVLARAVSATPPSMVIVAPVLGGPECARARRVVLSSSSSIDVVLSSSSSIDQRPVLSDYS